MLSVDITPRRKNNNKNKHGLLVVATKTVNTEGKLQDLELRYSLYIYYFAAR